MLCLQVSLSNFLFFFSSFLFFFFILFIFNVQNVYFQLWDSITKKTSYNFVYILCVMYGKPINFYARLFLYAIETLVGFVSSVCYMRFSLNKRFRRKHWRAMHIQFSYIITTTEYKWALHTDTYTYTYTHPLIFTGHEYTTLPENRQRRLCKSKKEKQREY